MLYRAPPGYHAYTLTGRSDGVIFPSWHTSNYIVHLSITTAIKILVHVCTVKDVEMEFLYGFEEGGNTESLWKTYWRSSTPGGCIEVLVREDAGS